jgi:hypothetical protein
VDSSRSGFTRHHLRSSDIWQIGRDRSGGWRFGIALLYAGLFIRGSADLSDLYGSMVNENLSGGIMLAGPIPPLARWLDLAQMAHER